VKKPVSKFAFRVHNLRRYTPGLVDVHVHLNEPGRETWEGGGCTAARNRSTYHVKPCCLSRETVLPVKGNRSTYQVKPFCLSRETVLPITW
jgi:hypothetical protein